jgi:hypothetical protein
MIFDANESIDKKYAGTLGAIMVSSHSKIQDLTRYLNSRPYHPGLSGYNVRSEQA